MLAAENPCQEFFMNLLRRRFLLRLISGSGMLWGLGRMTAPTALAMGQYPQGVRKARGQVTVDGIAAQVGDPVRIGDAVQTGPDGMVIFVVETAVFLLREQSHLQLSRDRIDESRSIDVIRLLEGKMLGVFSRRREKKLITATAVTGIRGSAAYAETRPDLTYLCLCYGRAEIVAIADSKNREELRTRHHEAPRYIDAAGHITPAPVVNHTDAELTLLESMVGRRPPFAGSGEHGY
ncbi:MAG: hypothetical protein PVG78_15890 [Desulfobacterales bacterium]|jgi:hypothetical protein